MRDGETLKRSGEYWQTPLTRLAWALNSDNDSEDSSCESSNVYAEPAQHLNTRV